MAIPGDVVAQIQKALLSAYPKESVLEQMVRIELDESLHAIAGGENQSELVFVLIRWAESHGRLKDLFDAAVRQNPKNPDLTALAADEQLQTILSAATKSDDTTRQWAKYQRLWEKVQDRYYDSIIQQHGKIRIFGQTKPKSLTAIFTDVYVLDIPSAHSRFSREEVADYLLMNDRSRSFRHGERKPVEELLNKRTKFIVLGKPGAGKTTLLRHLALREAQSGLAGHRLGKVPIFVSLKQYASARKPLLDFIVEQFAVCRLPDAAPYVDALLESGDALVLFDGLDEVASGEEARLNQRSTVAEELERFALRYSNCHVIISARIAAINYTFHPDFAYLELADFTPKQVEYFVHHWLLDETNPNESAALAKRMLAELGKPGDEGIRDLARNPLLLTMLCLNYAKTGRFPVKRAEMYGETLDTLLKTWDVTRQIGRDTRYKTLSLGRKRQMFARIAYDAFTQNKILFEQSELVALLLAYLKHVPELPESIDIDGDAVLAEIIAQHGIFTEQAHRLYSFSHLTFQEYYTAKYIADDQSANSITILMEHITDDKWREVTLMTASLLPVATDFLENFASALMQLATSNPQLGKILMVANTQAALLQFDSRQSIIRLLLLAIIVEDAGTGITRVALDLARALDLALARDFIIAIFSRRSLALDLARALDRALACDLARDLKDALKDARSFYHYNKFVRFRSDIESYFDHALGKVEGTVEGKVESARDLNLAWALDLALDGVYLLDVALALGRDRAIALARALDRVLDRDLYDAISNDPAFGRDRDFARALDQILTRDVKNALRGDLDHDLVNALRNDLDHDLVNALAAVVYDPYQDLKDRFFENAVKDALDRHYYRSIERARQDARARLMRRAYDDDSYRYSDLDPDLELYLTATRLFYDCIQLANTPERRAFEDRILEPPP